jgi:hypothetical protein
MTRYFSLVAIVSLSAFLVGCSADSATGAATSVRDGLTHVGEKVQSIGASDELKNATESAKAALTTTGEVAISGADTAKGALTTVGETTLKVGAVAEATLTTIGNTVLEAKANLAIPEPAPAAAPAPVEATPIVSKPITVASN